MFEILEGVHLYCTDVKGMERYLTFNKSYYITKVLKEVDRLEITDDNGKICHAAARRFSFDKSAVTKEQVDIFRLQAELAGARFDYACLSKRVDLYIEEIAQMKTVIMSATSLISNTVTRLRRWANPNSFLGKDLTELSNDNSHFLAQHPEYFNEHLKQLKMLTDPVNK